MSTASNDKRAARERLAAERAAAAAKQKKQRMIMNVVVVALVVVIGGIGWWAVTHNSTSTTADTGSAVPAGAVSATGGFRVGTRGATIDVWEDLQCPYCHEMEVSSADRFAGYAAAGTATIEYHMLSFLDNNLKNDASNRGTNMMACVAQVGGVDKAIAFKGAVYANFPKTEGDGWTDDQLKGFAAKVGVSGDTLNSCYSAKTYNGWVKNQLVEMQTKGIAGTPAVFFNGTELQFTPGDDASLAAALKKAGFTG